MGEYRLATVGDALAEYLSDLVIRDRSPRTVATYRSLLRFPTMMLADFDRAYCRAWLADQVRTRKPAGAATAWGALKGFGRWLLEQGYVSVDPVAGIHGPRVPEGPRLLSRPGGPRRPR